MLFKPHLSKLSVFRITDQLTVWLCGAKLTPPLTVYPGVTVSTQRVLAIAEKFFCLAELGEFSFDPIEVGGSDIRDQQGPMRPAQSAAISLSSARRPKSSGEFQGSDRSEQSSHPHERPRAQGQDQASHQQHQQSVRYDFDQVTGERGADEPAEHQRNHRREIG